MTSLQRHLRVPAELDRLAEVRQLVRDTARDRAARHPDCIDDMTQAVDEAAANTIVHGYAGTPGWLDVTVAVDGARAASSRWRTRPRPSIPGRRPSPT